jgi:hypothetical protein
LRKFKNVMSRARAPSSPPRCDGLIAAPSVAVGALRGHGVYSLRSLTPSSVPRAGAPGGLDACSSPPSERCQGVEALKCPPASACYARVLGCFFSHSLNASMTLKAIAV